MKRTPVTQKKKANQKGDPSPDGQEGRGHQHSERWSPKDSNGISEGLGTEKGLILLHLIYLQKDNQSTKSQRTMIHS